MVAILSGRNYAKEARKQKNRNGHEPTCHMLAPGLILELMLESLNDAAVYSQASNSYELLRRILRYA